MFFLGIGLASISKPHKHNTIKEDLDKTDKSSVISKKDSEINDNDSTEEDISNEETISSPLNEKSKKQKPKSKSGHKRNKEKGMFYFTL